MAQLIMKKYKVIHKISGQKSFEVQKYVQSDLGDCFSEIKKETKCFIGTPCQVYGLKSYLKKNTIIW